MPPLNAAPRWRARGPVPRLWLLSDPARLPDPLPTAARLPRGAAVIARNLPATDLTRLARVVRRRGLRLFVAGDGRLALRHAAGLHVPDRRPTRHLLAFLRAGRLPVSVAAHGRAGLARARRLRAAAVLLSPAFRTASHPGATPLGVHRWAALARRAVHPVIALGGVDAVTARRLPSVAAGVAAIGGLAIRPVARAPTCDDPATVSYGSRGRAM